MDHLGHLFTVGGVLLVTSCHLCIGIDIMLCSEACILLRSAVVCSGKAISSSQLAVCKGLLGSANRKKRIFSSLYLADRLQRLVH
jgi:hypothetical protein